MGYSPWGRKESDMTAQLTLRASSVAQQPTLPIFPPRDTELEALLRATDNTTHPRLPQLIYSAQQTPYLHLDGSRD